MAQLPESDPDFDDLEADYFERHYALDPDSRGGACYDEQRLSVSNASDPDAPSLGDPIDAFLMRRERLATPDTAGLQVHGNATYLMLGRTTESSGRVIEALRAAGVDVASVGESCRCAQDGVQYEQYARLIAPWNVRDLAHGLSKVGIRLYQKSTADFLDLFCPQVALPGERPQQTPESDRRNAASNSAACSQHSPSMARDLKAESAAAHAAGALEAQYESLKRSNASLRNMLHNALERNVVLGQKLDAVSEHLGFLAESRSGLFIERERYHTEARESRERESAALQEARDALRQAREYNEHWSAAIADMEAAEARVDYFKTECERLRRKAAEVSDPQSGERASPSLEKSADVDRVDVRQLVAAVFPDVCASEHSYDVLRHECPRRDHVFQRLFEIRRQIVAGSQKVESCASWREVHFSTGQDDDGRIYYRKATSRWEVVISRKRYQKRDLKWLRSNDA